MASSGEPKKPTRSRCRWKPSIHICDDSCFIRIVKSKLFSGVILALIVWLLSLLKAVEDISLMLDCQIFLVVFQAIMILNQLRNNRVKAAAVTLLGMIEVDYYYQRRMYQPSVYPNVQPSNFNQFTQVGSWIASSSFTMPTNSTSATCLSSALRFLHESFDGQPISRTQHQPAVGNSHVLEWDGYGHIDVGVRDPMTRLASYTWRSAPSDLYSGLNFRVDTTDAYRRNFLASTADFYYTMVNPPQTLAVDMLPNPDNISGISAFIAAGTSTLREWGLGWIMGSLGDYSTHHSSCNVTNLGFKSKVSSISTSPPKSDPLPNSFSSTGLDPSASLFSIPTAESTVLSIQTSTPIPNISSTNDPLKSLFSSAAYRPSAATRELKISLQPSSIPIQTTSPPINERMLDCTET